MEKIMISGFSDEISSDFDEQLKVVTGLGMEYISLRTADGPSKVTTPATTGLAFVRVPVLSNTMVSASATDSR